MSREKKMNREQSGVRRFSAGNRQIGPAANHDGEHKNNVNYYSDVNARPTFLRKWNHPFDLVAHKRDTTTVANAREVIDELEHEVPA